MTRGIFLGETERSASFLIDRLAKVADRRGDTVPATGFDQLRHEIAKAQDDGAAAAGSASPPSPNVSGVCGAAAPHS